MPLPQRDAAFLLRCLRFLGAQAPCRARIEGVIASVAGTEDWRGSRVPDTVFARALSIAAIVWAIDSGLVAVHERDVAQDVLEALWAMGAIRPELIGAQLRCLVGQEPGDRHCLWTCPAMRRANAGFSLAGRAFGEPALPDLAGTVRRAAAEAPASADGQAIGDLGRWLPGRGARIRCRECGRSGTVLGVDGDDGWTVIEHHPPLHQRADGLWEVHLDDWRGPRQCRFLAGREAASPA